MSAAGSGAMTAITVKTSAIPLSSSSQTASNYLIGAIGGPILVLILALAIFVIYARKQKEKLKPVDFSPLVTSDELKIDGERKVPSEIPREHLITEGIIAKSKVSEVIRAQFRGTTGILEPVAAKISQLHSKSAISQALILNEAAVMAQFDHLNVIRLIGVVTVGRPFVMVLELCSNGTLLDYLKTHATSQIVKQAFTFDIASAMAYLASRNFVHRDVAARNVLMTCKITNLGFFQDSTSSDYYFSGSGQLPIRWTAPEALEHHLFTEQSDVWSFGILMYEIWTDGEEPYEGWRNEKVWVFVVGGYRLPCPVECPKKLHGVMTDCWKDVESRPSFEYILDRLKSAKKGVSFDKQVTHPPANTGTFPRKWSDDIRYTSSEQQAQHYQLTGRLSGTSLVNSATENADSGMELTQGRSDSMGKLDDKYGRTRSPIREEAEVGDSTTAENE